MSILVEILDHKRREVVEAKKHTSAAELSERAASCGRPVRSFTAALTESATPRVIAEIKRRSPSKGEIRADFDPVAIAKAYADGGAAALSVLTDEHFFGGSLDVLRQVRAVVELPLLCKEFVVDEYQLDEARVAGADAVLLIVAALPKERLVELRVHAEALGLDVLVEVHDAAEMEVAVEVGARVVGINNRDLATFEVDLGTTEALAASASPGCVLVAESGIATPADVQRLEAAGAHAYLVGESLMRQPDPGRALAELRSTR
ncbi:MAG: indole-3-glycerol phosphate synthase TrpC [Deltaproteobacteria bacterium]|nr:indole-3-glycerol phosphate synthase TrpC [Deltaproteobacteria bacterium]MBW2444656.1 indole-3-glycerol phosphate synthase TrpC [Deltaproteobacteria bacterium]